MSRRAARAGALARRLHTPPGTVSGAARGPHNGVLVLSGYGLRVGVERGHLITEDGVGDERRRLRFSRLAPGLKRLVVVGRTGQVSLAALDWLDGVGIHLLHLGHDGRLIAVGVRRQLDDSRLRRAQAVAPYTGAALAGC